MRAQISLEYLLISAVAMAMLILSASALLGIMDYSEESRGRLDFRYSADALANAIDEVCALGSGNRREVELRSKVSLEWEEGGMRISGRGSMAYPALCEVAPEEGLEGIVSVENEKGMVKIREQ